MDIQIYVVMATQFFTAAAAFFAYLQSRKNTGKADENRVALATVENKVDTTHTMVNGRLQELLAVTRTDAYAQGLKAGKEAGQIERSDLTPPKPGS